MNSSQITFCSAPPPPPPFGGQVTFMTHRRSCYLTHIILTGGRETHLGNKIVIFSSSPHSPPPPRQLSGCILFALPERTRHVLCNKGGITYWGGGGGYELKRSRTDLTDLNLCIYFSCMAFCRHSMTSDICYFATFLGNLNVTAIYVPLRQQKGGKMCS